MAICFQRAMLVKLNKRILGDDTEVSENDVISISSEIMNIVLGTSKADLNRRGYGIEQALPQTFVAKEGQMITPGLFKPSWMVDFTNEIGAFFLEVTIRPVEL